MQKKSILKLSALPILCAVAFISCRNTEKQTEPELIVVESHNLKCNDSSLVFTPNLPAERLQDIPSLILMHGWGGCYSNWSSKHDIQEISNRTEFRIICPDGFYNSWYLDNTDTTQMQWRKFFDTEYFPLLKEKYNLHPDRTFITGLSMGGHGAVNLFLDHPENFRACGSMSGVLDLQMTSLRDTELKKVIGDSTGRIDSESAINRAFEMREQLKEIGKPIIVSCGYNDVYVRCSDAFSAMCRREDIPHILLLSPGKHSWTYWGFALEEHLSLFTKILHGENLGY